MGAKDLFTSVNKKDVPIRFDLIISTIPTGYNINDYVDLLKYGGEMAIVGLPPSELKQSIDLARLIFAGGKKVYGSMIGGIKETQEMLDFSFKA